MKPSRWFFPVVMGLLAVPLAGRAADSDAVAVRKHLDGLRGIQVPAKEEKAKFDELNKRMDVAWAFIASHEAIALPIVEDELRKAVAAKMPDQFFLLDMGNLLAFHRGKQAAGLGLSALARLDPKSEIVQANWVELFHFVMRLGAMDTEPARYLEQMDRLYLDSKLDVTFFQAPHYVQLTPLDVESMVYGVAGEPAAQHLAAMLGRKGTNNTQVLSILSGIGSEDYVPQVAAVMTAARDAKTIGACVTYLMEVGGPAGRSAVRALNVTQCDAEAQAYYKKIQPEVEKVSFPAMIAILEAQDNTPVSDAKLQQLLDAMEAHDGADNQIPPVALLKSRIPAGRLLTQLKRTRYRSFRRETNHVFEDLEMTNFIINALQFKMAKS